MLVAAEIAFTVQKIVSGSNEGYCGALSLHDIALLFAHFEFCSFALFWPI
jgi:hypothetical protein